MNESNKNEAGENKNKNHNYQMSKCACKSVFRYMGRTRSGEIPKLTRPVYHLYIQIKLGGLAFPDEFIKHHAKFKINRLVVTMATG